MKAIARTHAHRHIGSTSRVPACIFHSIVSTTYLDTIYLKMVKWWCTMWCVNCDKIFVHIMTLHYLSPALPHLFSFLFCSTAPFPSLSLVLFRRASTSMACVSLSFFRARLSDSSKMIRMYVVCSVERRVGNVKR